MNSEMAFVSGVVQTFRADSPAVAGAEWGAKVRPSGRRECVTERKTEAKQMNIGDSCGTF